MKKLITTALIIILLVNTGMSQIFDGISLKENTQNLIEKLESKGFNFDYGMGNTIRLSGEYDSKETRIYVVNTVKSNKPVVLSAYIGDSKTWGELLNEYKKYVKVFSDKYGNPDYYYASFKPPYNNNYKGREMEAVRKDKSDFMSEWTRDGINYSVEIFKYNSIIVTYRNEENFELNKVELK
jgi:hypothetical protein